ncbi:TPA: DotA/TraY family protein [Klebsiella quasipneumoniae subsp. similipneumoniae]|nr:DotA/TraY family protein [Klebsiella quasipneumoniae subsp. similipneumoniae]
MTLLKRLFWGGLALALTTAARADSVTYGTIADAAKNNEDLSRQALIAVFGQVVADPFQASEMTVMGALFALMNGVLACIALFWFLTITLKHVTTSGAQGQVFGSGRSYMYPVMTLAGFISIVPTGSGWSIAQLTMLWAASIMGIGSANLLTNKGAEMIGNGYSLITQPTAASTRTASRTIFETMLCRNAINARQSEMENYFTQQMMEIEPSKDNRGYTITNGNSVCGTVGVPVMTRSSSWNNKFDIASGIDVTSIQDAQLRAMDTMVQTLDTAAGNFVNAYLNDRISGEVSLPDAETAIQNAAAAYENSINRAINSLNVNENSMQSKLISQLKSYGWVALGSWYHTFATANEKTAAVAQQSPVTTGFNGKGDSGQLDTYNAVMAAYTQQLQNSSYTPTIGTKAIGDDLTVVDSKDPNNLLKDLYQGSFESSANYIALSFNENQDNNQTNPLLRMKNVGDYTLGGAQVAFANYIGAKIGVAWVTGTLFGRVVNTVTGAGDVAKNALEAIQAPFYFILFILISIGFSLSIFLPFIPFIYWIAAVTNWFVSVLIGCTAGPLWAATHIGTEADKGSRSAYGYVFLIDMMIRPSLMVFGFFFASLGVVAVGTILNLLFAAAIANVQVDSITGLISFVGILMIYARICTTLVTRLFGLQVTMPDYVISFLGGREAANVMGGMVESVKGMFAGFGRGAGNISKAKQIESKQSNPDSKTDGIS